MTVGEHPGAVWRRVDLQCHTPHDTTWRGSEPLHGEGEAAETARHAWAREFISAANQRGLDVIAVTDHHDHVMLPYVIRASRESGHVAVMPGIEVTCRDNVQVLAIFEPTTTRTEWDRFLAKLPSFSGVNTEAARPSTVNECGFTVAELFKVVAQDTLLSSLMMLIPHFGPPTAYKSLNAQGHAPRARDLPCDGVYIECEYSSLDTSTLAKIQGQIPEWGSRRRAIVATGDNKRANWERLGAHPCWLKLGELSIEAIRQSFLADEARITYSSPLHPSERIVKVEIQSLLTGDEPLTITFNDGFNALIGGRGSGKSAVLEYLRFGLGKSETDVAQADLQGRKRRDREAELIADTLVGGWVAVTLERQGVVETWRRHGDHPEEIVAELLRGGPHRSDSLAA